MSHRCIVGARRLQVQREREATDRPDAFSALQAAIDKYAAFVASEDELYARVTRAPPCSAAPCSSLRASLLRGTSSHLLLTPSVHACCSHLRYAHIAKEEKDKVAAEVAAAKEDLAAKQALVAAMGSKAADPPFKARRHMMMHRCGIAHAHLCSHFCPHLRSQLLPHLRSRFRSRRRR